MFKKTKIKSSKIENKVLKKVQTYYLFGFIPIYKSVFISG